MTKTALYETEVITAFHQAGLVPFLTQSIEIEMTNDEWVQVTAKFAITADQLQAVWNELP